MKTIGILGGMSWESTAMYYRLINQSVKQTLGGYHSAKILLASVDFAEIEQLQRAGNWENAAKILSNEAIRLQEAGADFIIIATNTMHKVAPEIENSLSIPLLHIAGATASQLLRDNIHHVGLLGTKFTMSQSFYREHLEQQGIRVTVPKDWHQEIVHEIIYQELIQGEVTSHSRKQYLSVIDTLSEQGVEAIILGCTEIGLLVQQHHTPVPLYDTTNLHASAAVNFALSDE